ncbi:MAG: hypothetical protein OXH28_10620 [bacterium]|nr:hypothetical protein [bacterium]
MGDSPRSRRRPRLILLAACAAVALLLAACFDEGAPTSFDDTVEANFLNGCELAAEADPQISPVALRYCGCAYDRVRTEISFDDFKQLDDDVKDDPDKIIDDDEESAAARLAAIFADCRAANTRG